MAHHSQLERLGALGSNVLLTHAITVKDEEVDFARAVRRKGSSLPRSSASPRQRCGPASEESRRCLHAAYPYRSGPMVCAHLARSIIRGFCSLVAGLFKDARMDATLIPAETALEMATLNGAKGLLWDNEIGSLEVRQEGGPYPV